jgi:3-oxoacyl-[acyl-carrier-protein] synthase-3
VADEKHFIHMNGREVFKWAVVAVEQAARRTLQLAKATTDDVDLFIPHQANIRIIENSARRLGYTMDKVYVNLDRYGNTSAASIPIALDEVVRGGRVKTGNKVLGVAFGAGLSWAGMFLEWTKQE